jgi:hypothetical protein
MRLVCAEALVDTAITNKIASAERITIFFMIRGFKMF